MLRGHVQYHASTTRSLNDPRMSHPLRFPVLLLPNVGWAELRTRVLRLEELGGEISGGGDGRVPGTQ
jgi:hypothetical protein